MEPADGAPAHVRGVCDIVDCDGVASRAFRDEDGEVYVEVCADHAGSFDGFDSDYTRVERDSPYRGEPERTGTHDCGGELRVYLLGDSGDEEGVEHRFCTGCGYALLIEHTGEDSMRVRAAQADVSRS